MKAKARAGHLQALTEANLKRLQPSIIKPMPPMSISSGDNTAPAEMDVELRVLRLKSWVYNAMQSLVSLGNEGQAVLDVDELYIAGPGDVRLRAEAAANKGVHAAMAEAGNDQDEDPSSRPNLADPAYWEAKLRYLEEQCKPLCQAKRKRRRLNQGAAAADEVERFDAVKEGSRARAEATANDEEEQRLERVRVEESKLLWRYKHASILSWMNSVQSLATPRAFSPLPETDPQTASRTIIQIAQAENLAKAPPSSDSSIIEITSTQFSHAVGGRQRMSEAMTTPLPAAATTSAPAAKNSVTDGPTLEKDQPASARGAGALSPLAVAGQKRRRHGQASCRSELAEASDDAKKVCGASLDTCERRELAEQRVLINPAVDYPREAAQTADA